MSELGTSSRSVFDTSPTRSRREEFLNLAADLFAARGYHGVGIDDIGAKAGVTGPAIYRYFDSKSALLTALFNKLTDEFVARAADIVASHDDPQVALRALVRYQTEICVYDRSITVVYLHEFHSLPSSAQTALRVKQRPYFFDWMRTLSKIHPEYSEGELRALTHAAIGVCHSVIYYRSSLHDEELIEVVARAAEAVFGDLHTAVEDPVG